MYRIHVVYECIPGKREALVEKIKKEGIADEVRKENGCIRYDYYFSEKDPNELLLVEAWESKAHQQTHVEQPHMAKFREFKGEYVVNTTVEEV